MHFIIYTDIIYTDILPFTKLRSMEDHHTSIYLYLTFKVLYPAFMLQGKKQKRNPWRKEIMKSEH
jgi:hypothetical protein